MNTILFDLDGTLLPMEQEVFLKRYMGALSAKLAPFGYEPKALIDGVWKGMEAMVANNGCATNESVFWETFSAVLGEGVRQHEAVFEEFYKNEFVAAKEGTSCAPQAAMVIRTLREKGYELILATNPVFPRVATLARMGWAGISPEDFRDITTYEHYHACKPNPAYFREILEKNGKTPADCLMVGNDTTEDGCAAKAGIELFYLTDCLINEGETDIAQYRHGDFDTLLRFAQSLPPV